MSFACGTCWQTWPTWRSRDQHVAAKFHQAPDFECDTCDRYFGSSTAVEQHMNALDHWAESSSNSSGGSEYDCYYDGCTECFDDEQELQDHEIHEHYYCSSCDRDFDNANSIKMHRKSKQHLGKKQPCYFCGKLYVTAAGIFYHLERGKCPKAPLDRMKVYEAVKQRDPKGLITERLRQWSGRSPEATAASWNPSSKTFDCRLCGSSFKLLNSLNQHLQSPKHQEKAYHCPNQRCGEKFSEFAAFTEHLQSESCNYITFEAVQETAKRIFDPGRMIAF
ncbi:Zinc finger protein 26 [Colletotrichum fructicola]|uniref:Zinc finger protein n=1 Tax=Colletotrichum fructicola (strain Nara gc5) TaxID=1213859 RepID=L2G7E4_COLFN|nr:Zinc finger protein 26 [Colletotrichum fructicola]